MTSKFVAVEDVWKFEAETDQEAKAKLRDKLKNMSEQDIGALNLRVVDSE